MLVIVGVAEVVRTWKENQAPVIRLVHQLALFGFIIGPLTAATFKEPRPIQRTLVIVPFGVLLATVGVVALWTRIRSLWPQGHVETGVGLAEGCAERADEMGITLEIVSTPDLR